MRSNKDRKLNLGTAFRLTIMNQFVKKNLDVKIHKLCNLANIEEIQCSARRLISFSDIIAQVRDQSLCRVRMNLVVNAIPVLKNLFNLSLSVCQSLLLSV